MNIHNMKPDNQRGVPRVPERFLTGDATLKEYLEFLRSIDPKQIGFEEYIKLADLVEELAKALNIPE